MAAVDHLLYMCCICQVEVVDHLLYMCRIHWVVAVDHLLCVGFAGWRQYKTYCIYMGCGSRPPICVQPIRRVATVDHLLYSCGICWVVAVDHLLLFLYVS